MKKYLALGLLLSFTALAQWYYGSGEIVGLENKIRFKNGITLESGSATPSGLSRATGSLYQKNVGELYLKFGAATSSWVRFATASDLNNYVLLSGDAMTGPLRINSATASTLLTLQATASTVFYVDATGSLIYSTDIYSGKRGVSTSLFTGVRSGANNGSGSFNTAYGFETLTSTLTGANNTIMGHSAGRLFSTGGGNTCIGSNACLVNSTGNNNTVIGANSLPAGLAGETTILGSNALQVNSVGVQNTAVGRLAGQANTGSRSVFLGYAAGQNDTNSDRLHIGNAATNSLIFGDFALRQVGIATQSVLSSAALQVDSLNKVFYPPRFSTSGRPASPVNGAQYYDNALNNFYGYINGTWAPFGTIASLNGLATASQTFATGSSGNDFNISSVGSTHTFNIPDASASARGALTQANFQLFNAKVDGPTSSVNNELVLFNGTTGKLIKSATGTGVAKVTSGVFSTGSVNISTGSTEITGTLPYGSGGTNYNGGYTNGHVIIATGSRLQGLAGTSAGQVLGWNGSEWIATSSSGGGGGATGSVTNTAYTPSTIQGFGTTTNLSCYYSYEAGTKMLNVNCKFQTGSTTAEEARISLPAGYTISNNSSKINNFQMCGFARAWSAAAVDVWQVPILQKNVTYINFSYINGSLATLVQRNGNDVVGNNIDFTFYCDIPID